MLGLLSFIFSSTLMDDGDLAALGSLGNLHIHLKLTKSAAAAHALNGRGQFQG